MKKIILLFILSINTISEKFDDSKESLYILLEKEDKSLNSFNEFEQICNNQGGELIILKKSCLSNFSLGLKTFCK